MDELTLQDYLNLIDKACCVLKLYKDESQYVIDVISIDNITHTYESDISYFDAIKKYFWGRWCDNDNEDE